MNTSWETRRSVKGFTLLEVLVAVSILGVAIVSLLGLHARNIRLISHSQDMSVAGLLASRLVASTKAGNTPDVGTEEGDFNDGFSLDLSTADVDGVTSEDRFRWRRVVEPTLEPTIRQVTVSVHLQDEETSLVEMTFLAGGASP